MDNKYNIIAQFNADYNGKFQVKGFMITKLDHFEKYLWFVQQKFVGKTSLVLPFGDGESLTFKDFATFKAAYVYKELNHAKTDILLSIFGKQPWGVVPYLAEFEAKAK